MSIKIVRNKRGTRGELIKSLKLKYFVCDHSLKHAFKYCRYMNQILKVVLKLQKSVSKYSADFVPNPAQKGKDLANVGLPCTLFMNYYI